METKIYRPPSEINLVPLSNNIRNNAVSSNEQKQYITLHITSRAPALSCPLSIVCSEPTIQQMQTCQATVD